LSRVVDVENFGALGGGEIGFGEDGSQDGGFAGEAGLDVYGGMGAEGAAR
jgi:hypothetical protein